MTTRRAASCALAGNVTLSTAAALTSLHYRLRRSGKRVLAILFSLLGVLSLIPALFWTFIYKWFTSIDVKSALMDYAKD